MKQFRASVVTIQLVIVANLVAVGWGQRQSSSGSSCLNQLAPCLNYLNGDDNEDVPDSCCDPLKYVIKSKPECLCRMISNRGSREAERAGINVTQAQQLPGRCGQHVNPLVCIPGSPNSKTSVENSAILSFPSHSTIIVAAISMAVQILLLTMI
ncbi:glycosylphosphatidylinositol-anchored lipid protein transfer 30 [Hibiscus trionum]|uniref:Glycosylphosphatidylinositol-anchored lipid protein transfer 30 n=1 Tax=Hibiscus trionum TaxID=183268 RepID=A0A9W7HYK8_HIBTR|nr:glycosylphosphatidylinositol-anchored lipid protein transfer 30 [Hibiscus trionum]